MITSSREIRCFLGRAGESPEEAEEAWKQVEKAARGRDHDVRRRWCRRTFAKNPARGPPRRHDGDAAEPFPPQHRTACQRAGGDAARVAPPVPNHQHRRLITRECYNVITIAAPRTPAASSAGCSSTTPRRRRRTYPPSQVRAENLK